MTPSIDGTPINTRIDWQHRLQPARAQGARLEGFPGVNELFAPEGPRMPPALILTGFLDGSGGSLDVAVQALHTAILAANALEGDGQVHIVTIHGIPYSNLSLRRFGTTGTITPARDAVTPATIRVRQGVRYEWRQLKQ